MEISCENYFTFDQVISYNGTEINLYSINIFLHVISLSLNCIVSVIYHLDLSLPLSSFVFTVRQSLEVNWRSTEDLIVYRSQQKVRVKVHLEKSGFSPHSHGARHDH